MDAFRTLPPHLRAYALVGCFLQHWALMESAMKKAIGKALDIDGPQLSIVAANLQLRDKIHILKTVVSITPIHPPEYRENFTKLLSEIANYSATRNMMAHDVFGATEDGQAVEFHVTKAKGKLSYPETIWAVDDFAAAFEDIADFQRGLDYLTDAIATAALITAAVSAATRPQPTPDTGLLGLLGLPIPPLPTGPDSSPPSPQTDGETPPKPQG